MTQIENTHLFSVNDFFADYIMQNAYLYEVFFINMLFSLKLLNIIRTWTLKYVLCELWSRFVVIP